MYAKKDDILQFVVNTPLGRQRYCFVLCPTGVLSYHDSIDINISYNDQQAFNICRDFHRFNLVLAGDSDIRDKVLITPDIKCEYKNRPYSELFSYVRLYDVPF